MLWYSCRRQGSHSFDNNWPRCPLPCWSRQLCDWRHDQGRAVAKEVLIRWSMVLSRCVAWRTSRCGKELSACRNWGFVCCRSGNHEHMAWFLKVTAKSCSRNWRPQRQEEAADSTHACLSTRRIQVRDFTTGLWMLERVAGRGSGSVRCLLAVIRPEGRPWSAYFGMVRKAAKAFAFEAEPHDPTCRNRFRRCLVLCLRFARGPASSRSARRKIINRCAGAGVWPGGW